MNEEQHFCMQSKRSKTTCRKFLPFYLLALILFGCGPKYENSGGNWYYTTWNEGQGTVRKRLKVNPDEFKVLLNGYAKDDQKVFYLGKEITEAEANSFVVLDEDYSADANHVFFQGHRIPLALPERFQRLGDMFGRDGKQIYCGTVPMEVARPDKFRVLHPNSSIRWSIESPVPVPKSIGSFSAIYGNAVATDGVKKYIGPKPVESFSKRQARNQSSN